jgi:FtsP/CotA-like multicopper oxidase with cupredoxin domain
MEIPSMRFPASSFRTILGSLLAFSSAALFAQSPARAAAVAPLAPSFQEAFAQFATTAAASDPADAVCQRQAAGSTVASPPNLYSSNGVLTVNFSFQTTKDLQGLTRYCYIYLSANGTTSYEAPTLRVNPGDKLVINFTNSLPTTNAKAAAMPGMTMQGDAATTVSGCNATSVSSNSTNLHFHGLNVSPACGQDEVIHTIIQAGQEFTYSVQIPSNEPAGLYWYHPHPHGFSQPQVLGGATGVIVVEGIQNFNSAVAGLPERVFVLRDQALSAAEEKISGSQPGNDLSVNYVPVTYPSYVPGVINTPVATKEFWRVANTAANSLLDLEIVDNGVAQTFQVVAVDGVPVTDSSGNPTTTPETSFVLPPGARVEFIYTTPKQGDTAQLKTLSWNNGPDGDADPGRPLANIVASSSTSDSGLPKTDFKTDLQPETRIPAVTEALPAQRFKALTASVTPTVQRNLYFSIKSDFSQFYITVAGQTPAPFSMSAPPSIVVRSGTVEEWTIQNQSLMDHAFHIHQIHFRTMAVNGTPVTDYTERDTVNVPHWSGKASDPYPSVTLLMDFTDPDIVGTFVYHCHILSHEDLGMMGAIQVLPPLIESTTTLTASAAAVAPGQSVTLTATVSGGSPTATGTVTFANGGTKLGTGTLNASGVATLATTSLPLGANSITAAFGGDTNYAASTSSPVAVTVANPPSIASVKPNYGAYAAIVTITGTNFGATQGGSTLTFNGVPAASTSFYAMKWSDTSISTTVPAGATTGNVVVKVGGLASNAVPFTVYPVPKVTSISPTSGPAGTLVTITGTSLLDGGNDGWSDFGSIVASFVSQSSTTLQVKVPSGATTGPIVLHLNGSSATTPVFTVGTAPTNIPAFSQGFSTSGMTLNGGATVSGSTLQLTDGGTFEARSAFFNTPVNVQAFTTDFDFQFVAAKADGLTFTIQNQGLNALGGFGAGLGYGVQPAGTGASIAKSVAVKFDIYNNNGEGSNSTGVYLKGASPTLPATNLTPSGVVLSNGDVLHAHIAYDGANLALTISDATTKATATQSYAVNIPAAVGANTAYVGFTGGTGGSASTQKILTWSYVAGD